MTIVYLILHIKTLGKPKTHCEKCNKKLKEHGWYNQKDCLNEKCEKFYYRDYFKYRDEHKK